jgi:hypothetical protein
LEGVWSDYAGAHGQYISGRVKSSKLPYRRVGSSRFWPYRRVASNRFWPYRRVSRNRFWPYRRVVSNRFWPYRRVASNRFWNWRVDWRICDAISPTVCQ